MLGVGSGDNCNYAPGIRVPGLAQKDLTANAAGQGPVGPYRPRSTDVPA